MKEKKIKKVISLRAKKMFQEEIRQILQGFTETEYCYCGSSDVFYTTGVKVMAKLCDAQWLFTDGMLRGRYLNVNKGHNFIVISFTRANGTLVYADGNGETLQTLRVLPDEAWAFPLEEMKLYYVNGVLMLPSEY